MFIRSRAAREHCRIFTIASRASSAAANLLVVGHHACVFEDTTLHFHGVWCQRPIKRKMLRREQAMAIAMQLDKENRKTARRLAKRVSLRLAARYLLLRGSGKARASQGSPWPFFRKFTDKIGGRLISKESEQLLYESMERFKLIYSLAKFFPAELPRGKRRGLAQVEAKIFQAAISYELKTHLSPDWSIGPVIATEITMDYLLAREFVRGRINPLVNEITRIFGAGFLTATESLAYRNLLKEDTVKARIFLFQKARPYSLGFWCLALTLCHRLLSGESTLSAPDAFWLGLADEVLDRNHQIGAVPAVSSGLPSAGVSPTPPKMNRRL